MMKRKKMASFLIFWCCISANLPVYATTVPLTDPTSESSVQESSSQEIKLIHEMTPTRLYGDTRYETAKVISEYYGKGKVNHVVLATGTNFADALSASVFAHEKNAPIVLVDSTVQDSQDALTYLRENLDINGTIYIIGGTGAIAHEFEAELVDMGFLNLVRIEGGDRYGTAYNIASSLEDRTISTVVISSGEHYPDALSISSFAANQGWPILLSPVDRLPQEVKAFLQEKQPSKVFITGGTGALSEKVISELQELLPQISVERLTGQSRFDTNALIARTFASNPDTVFLSTGTNFADALAGSVVAAQGGNPILFVDPDLQTLPRGLAKYLSDLSANTEPPNLVVFGGTGAVSDTIIKNAKALLSGEVKETSVFSIPDIKASINQGKNYTLPASVQAHLYNSDRISMPVKWNPQVVDTSKLGLQVFEGIVDGYDTRIKLGLMVSDPLPIAEYSTYFKPSELNRTENLRLAAKALDGKRLAPGEQFSFNQTVGERTVEAGFKEAMIIEGNVFTLGLGGGVCQVSSTLYNAAALAQLEIVERHHHSLTVGYVPPGQDATVAWPVLDFKFRNNTKDALVIRTSVEGNTLTIRIFQTF